jgi:hypothetical protein
MYNPVQTPEVDETPSPPALNQAQFGETLMRHEITQQSVQAVRISP